MDVFECIRKRRTVHAYKDEPVSEEDIYKILEAGRWAPSAANNQPVRYIVIKEKDVRLKIQEMVKEVFEMTIKTGKEPYATIMQSFPVDYMEKVPVMICVIADKTNEETTFYSQTHHQSAACASIQNMMLAARALELGTVWLTFWDPARVKVLLNVPFHFDVVGIVLLGHPVKFPELPFATTKYGFRPRKNITELVSVESYGQTYEPPSSIF